MKEDPAAHERVLTRRMQAVRVHHFGGLEAIVYEGGVPTCAGSGTGAGPRQGSPRRPVGCVGAVREERAASAVAFSARIPTSQVLWRRSARVSPISALARLSLASRTPSFTGAYAEYAVAYTAMIAPKPMRLSDVEAA